MSNVVFIPVDNLSQEDKVAIGILLKSCFAREVGIHNDPNTWYLLNWAQGGALQALMFVVEVNNKATIWNVCASSFGKNSNAVKEILTFYLAQERTRDIELFVDFYNPYWDKAISLYTSVGFSDPKTIIYNPTGMELLKLKITHRAENKKNDRLLANTEREKYFKKLGYRVETKQYPSALFNDISRQLVDNRPKEYTGFFFKDEELDDLVIQNLSSGNLTDTEIYGYPTNCQPTEEGNIFFHTHPGALNGLLVQPPSETDVSSLFQWNRIGSFIKHYVFSEDGVYSFSFSIRTIREFCENPGENQRIKDQVVDEYSDVLARLTTLYYDPFRMLANMTPENLSREKANNIVIDYYLEEVLAIKHPGKDFSVFDVKFWSRDFIRKVSHITDFFIWRDTCFGQVCPLDESVLSFNGQHVFTKLPFTNEQMQLLIDMEMAEKASLENFADNGLEVTYNDREEYPDLWKLANPYSYKNISQLFSLIGDDRSKYEIARELIRKQVYWSEILNTLSSPHEKSQYVQLATSIQLDPRYIQERRDQISRLKIEIEPSREKEISRVLGESLSAFDINKWVNNGRIGSVSAFGNAYTLSSVNDPHKKSIAKMFRHGLTSDAIHEIGSYSILQAVGAKYVPRTYGLIYYNNQFGIAIERLSMSLDKLAQLDYNLVTRNISKIIYKTRAGLAELHECGLIHKDIKPANIFIKFSSHDTISRAVLADFGTTSSKPFFIGGPYEWNAPEVNRNYPADMKSDIWALGISFLDVIMKDTEKPTWAGRYSGQLPRQAKKVLDHRTQEIVENMISLNPIQRRDVKAKIKPMPNMEVSPNVSLQLEEILATITFNIDLSRDVILHGLNIAGRCIDAKGGDLSVDKQASILLASLDIARKWDSRQGVATVRGVNESEEWDIITTLHGLITF